MSKRATKTDNATAFSNLGFAYDKLGMLPQSIDACRNSQTQGG